MRFTHGNSGDKEAFGLARSRLRSVLYVFDIVGGDFTRLPTEEVFLHYLSKNNKKSFLALET